MTRWWLGPLTAAVVSTGCTCADTAPKPAPAAGLISEVKQQLAARDAKLTSYRITVETDEGEHHARHEFSYRSPNRSRGHVFEPQELEVAFDGTRLVRVNYPSKQVEPIPLDLSPQETAFVLARTFMPFAPEGFRTPLLPSQGVTATRITREGRALVDVTVVPEPGVEVHYLLRPPAGDFVEKRTRAEGSERTLRVVAEQCDAALQLCVPTLLEESLTEADGGTTPIGRTRVTEVALNPELPSDLFSPR